MDEGEYCSGFSERVCQFVTGDLHGEEGVEEVPNIPEGLWLEKRWSRGEKGPIESGMSYRPDAVLFHAGFNKQKFSPKL